MEWYDARWVINFILISRKLQLLRVYYTVYNIIALKTPFVYSAIDIMSK